MTLRIAGVRHHSPACARLVAHLIERDRPRFVLIEGPSDFNPRLAEFALDHMLPIALYSYSVADGRPAQCWFPFLDYSPEWVALRQGARIGAQVRFIDLPHWQYRTLADARRRIASTSSGRQRPRYDTVITALCERFACDGDDALWDHLFESLPVDALDELDSRLEMYFTELRGAEPGSEQDRAREQRMAEWIAWAQSQCGANDNVLVVCGGWHKRALEHRWPTMSVMAEPPNETPQDERAAGCYLVPYEYRQVDALAGYGAGMQSPMFYQWAWQEGARSAHRRSVARIIMRLRAKQVAVSTADLVAFERQTLALSALRGHDEPTRIDVLDALQSTLIKEALDAPSPWTRRGVLTTQHHPSLREALLALTGDGAGRLHSGTPLPPLLHDVDAALERVGITLARVSQALVLDRRREADAAKAEVLWQLSTIGVAGVQLKAMQAPHAARTLPAQLRFEEHWSVVRDDHWFPNLIEAAAYGATLSAAARNRLLDELQQAPGDAAVISQCMLAAMRCRLLDLGGELAERLRTMVGTLNDPTRVAAAARVLLEVVHAGFWGNDTRELMERTLVLLAERILWLLETHQSSGAESIAGGVAALRVFDGMLRLRIAGFDAQFTLETLARFAQAPERPPAVRGAALGICYVHGHLGTDAEAQLLAVTRSVPVRDALGDFLYGLFSCARAIAIESNGIVRAVHAALEGMSTEDFLVALPQLRGAFSWFPPRERGAIAALVADLLGLSQTERRRLIQVRNDATTLLDAKRIEAQALEWARKLGVLS